MKAIKEYIEEKGITQRDFARLCGIHEMTISFLIDERRIPTTENLLRIHFATGISYEDLFKDISFTNKE